jgi:16S rRNA processing protein RimM
MKRLEPSFLVVGHINKAHGTKGEIFVWPLTDHPESTFAPGVILYVGDEAGEAPDPSWPSIEIEGARPFRRGFLVRFPGVMDRTQAEALHGRYLFRSRSELEALEEGELFYHQLVGMRVVTVGGEEVGEVVEVYELRPADLLEVRGPGGTHHIPFLSAIVKEVDVEGGILVIDPPEGLLELAG